MTLQQKLDVVASMLAERDRSRSDVHFFPTGSLVAICGYRRTGPLDLNTLGRDRCYACLSALRPPMK